MRRTRTIDQEFRTLRRQHGKQAARELKILRAFKHALEQVGELSYDNELIAHIVRTAYTYYPALVSRILDLAAEGRESQ